MSQHYSDNHARGAKLRKFISVALIANTLFFTPFSVTLRIGAVNAEDATTTDATIETSTTTDPGPAATSTGNDTVASTSSATTTDATDGAAPGSNASTTTADLATSTADIATTTPATASSTATTTPSGNGGTGGAGGDGGEGGETGEQLGTIAAEANGGTGGAAGTTTGTTTIRTGNAIANASLLNLVNTNFVNSIGELLFLSNLWAQSSDQFDLRTLGFFTGALFPFCAVCSGSSSLSVVNASDGSASNTVSGSATTGANLVATPGAAVIETGNAYAAANALNFLNNNFVDSKYLFLTYNNFGDWNGDIVFPNSETFAKVLASNIPLTSTTTVSLENTGTADIENNLNLNALSGGNAFASLGATSTVASGDAGTSANILNLVNSSLVGGASLNIMFNVQGAWSGKIYGLPPGIEMTRVPGGFVLSFESFDDMLEKSASATTSVSNDATATLRNDFDLSAVSGGNGAVANGGSIRSGDSYASANIINVANTNVVGRNMFWAIVNIFGDWSGDVAFGKPDLWVGGHADMDGSQLIPGRTVTYNYTVINNGDTDANDSWITVDLGSEHLSETGGTGRVSRNLGTIRPKESKTVTFTAALGPGVPANLNELVTSVAEVGSEVKDNNSADNSEKISVKIASAPSGILLGGHRRSLAAGGTFSSASATTVPSSAPFITIKKSASATRVTSSTTVDYDIVIKNTASKPAYGAKLYDRMTGPNGEIVDDEIWDIGTIKPNEEIRISYSIFFKNQTPSGDYPNTAYVVGAKSTSSSALVISNISAATVTVDSAAAPKSMKGELKPENVKVATSSLPAAESIEGESAGAPDGGAAIAHASEGSLVAAAWYATPTARELSVVTAVLILLAIAMIAIRRRYANDS